jgi:hypothetical protein
MRARCFDWVCLSLVILGAINWGLIGLFRFDVIAVLFGGMEGIISRIIYTLIALAGLYCLSFTGRAFHFGYILQNRLTKFGILFSMAGPRLYGRYIC